MTNVKSLGAKIISLKAFAKLRPKLKGKIVMTGGGFDPIHPGHVSLILESKNYGDILVVVVNGDWFLKNKKGKAFQDLKTRALIVSGLRGVDYVVPFEIQNDISVARALEVIRPHVYTKGGDRSSQKRIPASEVAVCKKYKIKSIFGVGLDKKWSSSWFLDEWTTFVEKNRRRTILKKN